MSRYLIRPYQPSDWNAIARIHDRARLDELRLTVGVEAFRTLADTAEPEGLFNGDLWVADGAGGVAGFVAAEEGEVSWLYVDPALYGRGIGRLLLRHARDHIGPGATTSVLAGNAPALALYQSEGFAIVETVTGHLQGMPGVPATGHTLRWPG